MGSRNAHTTIGQTFVCLCNQLCVCRTLRNAHAIPGGDTGSSQRCGRHARGRHRRILGFLERGRTAHERIGEIDRHVCNALERTGGCSRSIHHDAFQSVVQLRRNLGTERLIPDRLRVTVAEAFECEQIAQEAPSSPVACRQPDAPPQRNSAHALRSSRTYPKFR